MTPVKRLYFLDPASYTAPFQESSAFFHAKSRFDFNRSLNKCLSGGFAGIVFSENFLTHKELPDYLKSAQKVGLALVFHISAIRFSARRSLLLKLTEIAPLGLNISFTDSRDIPVPQIQSFPKKFCLFTFILTRKSRWTALPSWIEENTELYCPYKRSLRDPFLTPRQVYRFLKKRPVPFKPFQGAIYDERICPDMDLEPVIRPFLKNTLSGSDIRFSVIIPSYNNGAELPNTLKGLKNQNYPKRNYELIVVDDGSDDSSLHILKNFARENGDINISVLSLPRVIPRKAGDFRFRAGIARNSGVKHTRGRFLAFLDADIITPPDYLKGLERDHFRADVVQLKRYHLKSGVDIGSLPPDPEKWKKIRYIEDERYWGAFYKKGFENSRPPWKYICTYGLSLSKKDFTDCGRFGSHFTGYGFEDTDLGWRLYKAKKKFLLSDTACLHQPPKKNRREHKSFFNRQEQLSKTAKIFFHNHPDPEIYEELAVYMKQERGLSYFFPALHRPVFPALFPPDKNKGSR